MKLLNKSKKSLGQNFLVDKNIIKKIIDIGNLNKNIIVMEIGVGYGNLIDVILTKNSKKFSGNFCLDDNVLADNGVTDFSVYANVPFNKLAPDFFVPEDVPPPENSIKS